MTGTLTTLTVPLEKSDNNNDLGDEERHRIFAGRGIALMWELEP